MVLGEIFPDPWLIWFQLIVIFSLVYTIWQLYEYKPARTLLLALSPYAVVLVSTNFIENLAPSFYKDSNHYFESAATFAFIWLVAFTVMANNQKKALAKVRLERETGSRTAAYH